MYVYVFVASLSAIVDIYRLSITIEIWATGSNRGLSLIWPALHNVTIC